MTADLRKKIFVSNGCHQTRTQLRIPPVDFIVIRPKRRIADSMQKESDKLFSIFFGKLCSLLLNVCELGHRKINYKMPKPLATVNKPQGSKLRNGGP